VAEALARGGEVISVDSRQVYRTLDIGTEKITREEMRGVPHHLIDVREPTEAYSAGDFVHDAAALITDISQRGKLPILAGGTHFYFDALLYGLPAQVAINSAFRATLANASTEELFARVAALDPRRASTLDPRNRDRLVRALEIIRAAGTVPERTKTAALYGAEWIVLDPPREELRAKIDTRLAEALTRGLIEEVSRVRALVGDARLNTFGLEYRIVGEYVRGERDALSILPALSAKLWQYARRQKAWLRKLRDEAPPRGVEPRSHRN
jgi:tRNA dimethylallyltransferase